MATKDPDPPLDSEATMLPEESTAKTMLQGSPGMPREGSSEVSVARGSLLGRYVVLRELGRGAMGAVHEAFDPKLERKVALKIMHGARARSTDMTEGSARMLREAQAMAKLSHRNVITVYDVGTFDGQVFLAMELIEGGTLKEWLATPRPLSEKLPVLVAAGEGLLAAHQAGVVHRDFKPDNVLVGNDDRVVVLDFGLATAASRSQETSQGGEVREQEHDDDALVTSGSTAELTRTGAIMGTPAYMAPEQHLGQALDARSDQFAFCVTVYEAICGQRPFRGDTLAALMFQVVSDEVQPPPAAARMPRTIERALRRGLSSDADRRHESLAPLLAVLRKDPRARRRRVLALGAVAAVGILAVGTTTVRERQRVAACDDNSEALGGIWSDDQREKARQQLTSGHKIGGEVFARVDATLSEYGAAWLEVDAASCREDTDPDTRRLRELCLQDARTQLEVASSVIADAKPDWIPQAIALSHSLPDLLDCANAADLDERYPQPPEGDRRARVQSARVELGRAQAHATADQLDVADEILGKVKPEVEALAFDPLTAEFKMALGSQRAGEGKLEPAEAAYWDAVALARSAHHPVVEAAVWANLVYLVGHTRARPAEVMHWLPVARASSDASPLPGQQIMFNGNLGSVYLEMGDFPEAQAHYQASLDAIIALRGPKAYPVATYLGNMGIALASQGELDEALVYFHEALAIRQIYYGEDHPATADTIHNLALAELTQGNIENAEDLMKRVVSIREASLDQNHPDLALSIGMLGKLYWENDRPQEAATQFRKAMEIRRAAHRPTHPEITSMQMALALALAKGTDTTEARTLAEDALRNAIEEHGANHPKLPPIQENLAVVLNLAGDHLAAAQVQAEVSAMRAELGEDADTLAYSRNAEAEFLSRGGEHAASLALIHETLALTGITPVATAWTILEQAQTQARAGDRATARELIVKAYALLRADEESGPALAPSLSQAWLDAGGDGDFVRKIAHEVEALAPDSSFNEEMAKIVNSLKPSPPTAG